MIVSCGEALVDLVPDPVPGGGPMNVAVAASRLGVPSAFIGALSTDDHGRRITDHLTANHVDISACPRIDRPTARAIVEHTPELVFRFEGHDTADTMLESADLDRLGAEPHIIHGGTLGLFRGRTAETLATLVEQRGATDIVSLDPNVRPQIIDDRQRWHHFYSRWSTRSAIYKGSDEDLEWIHPGRQPESVAEELVASGVDVVILTKGGDGLVVYRSDGEVAATAPPVTVTDTVGAGDTVVASILGSLWEMEVRHRADLADLATADWAEIGRRAVTAAAITCSRPGADPPFRSEVDW